MMYNLLFVSKSYIISQKIFLYVLILYIILLKLFRDIIYESFYFSSIFFSSTWYWKKNMFSVLFFRMNISLENIFQRISFRCKMGIIYTQTTLHERLGTYITCVISSIIMKDWFQKHCWSFTEYNQKFV